MLALTGSSSNMFSQTFILLFHCLCHTSSSVPFLHCHWSSRAFSCTDFRSLLELVLISMFIINFVLIYMLTFTTCSIRYPVCTCTWCVYCFGLRWRGSLSVEVNKNVTVRTRVWFRAILLWLILKRVLVAH